MAVRVRKRRERREEPEEKPERSFEEPTLPARIEVAVDQASQVQALAFGLEDPKARKLLIALGVSEESYTVREYSDIWKAIEEANEADVAKIDEMTLASYVEDPALVELAKGIRKHLPPDKNLLDVVDRLRWGAAVVEAANAVPPFAELLRTRSRPNEVMKAAKSILEALEVGRPVKSRGLSTSDILAQQIEAMKLRKVRGRYPFGLPGLDVDEEKPEGDPKRYRTTVGVSPGKTTVITALSGNGKSTLIANIVKAQIRLFGRKFLYGAWEDKPGEVLELVAAIDQGINLTRLVVGELTDEEQKRHAEAMAEFAERIVFMPNPLETVRKVRYRNDEAFDLIQQYIIESGCDIAVFDLWDRAFSFESEQEEKEALFRQQAIASATDAHVILANQQLLKVVEKREDKMPTREGNKGSGEWTGIADTMFGVYRPDKYKNVPKGTIEVPILKQRRGDWPLNTEFEYDPEYGEMKNGHDVPYNQPGTRLADSKNELDVAINNKRNKGKRGR